jgi:hypothetical protein
MPPTPPSRGPLRSAAELNARIRALWTGPGGHPAVPLSDEKREEYQQLCVELRDVERGDVTTAA